MSRQPWVLAPEGSLCDAKTVELDAEETRHLQTALRCGPGDLVTMIDGAGWLASGEVSRIRKGLALVEVRDREQRSLPDGPAVILAVAVLHGQAMDWAIQKAVEIGVRRFAPVMTEHVQLSTRAAERRVGHWRRVAIQALKQCQRPWAMAVDDLRSLFELTEEVPDGLVADPAGDPLVGMPGCGEPTLLVGPEGGLAHAELERLDAAGWRRVWLGPHVLRAETAAVVGAALVLDALRRARAVERA